MEGGAVHYYPPIEPTNENSLGKENRLDSPNKEELLNFEWFQELVKELDDRIQKAVEDYYEQVTGELDRLVSSPSAGPELVQTLIIRGQCIDWDYFIKLLNAKLPQLVIGKPEGGEVQELIRNMKAKEKLLLLFNVNMLPNLTELFSWIENRPFTYLALYTAKTFGDVYERIPRDMVTRMKINKIIFPAADKFLHYMFNEQMPLGFLRNNGVLFHGKTLTTIQRLFHYENHSLMDLRRIFLLALHDYAFNATKIENKIEKREFSEHMIQYSQILSAFAKIAGEDKLTLHSKIQGDPNYFNEFYSNILSTHYLLNRKQWRQKMIDLLPALCSQWLPKEYLKKCENIISELEKESSSERLSENRPPKLRASATSSSSYVMRRTVKTNQLKSAPFMAEQEHRRNNMNMKNLVSDDLRKEIYGFLDNLFQKYLGTNIDERFIAGPGDIALLSPSLTAEIDFQLGASASEMMMNAKTQKDICLAYYLLVAHSSDFTSIMLDSLANNFQELAQPIEGMELRARFMAAISQLEHIGALKMVSEGVVRLIYLPGATITKDLYQHAK